jgi:hypothetical protein
MHNKRDYWSKDKGLLDKRLFNQRQRTKGNPLFSFAGKRGFEMAYGPTSLVIYKTVK